MAKRQSIGNIKRLIEQITSDILVKANLLPKENGAAELGSDDNRYANLFVQDLNLANDRGDYTIIEEESYLTMRNNKTGKLYKILMEEIKEGE